MKMSRNELVGAILIELENQGVQLVNSEEIYDCANYLEDAQSMDDYTVLEYVQDTITNFPEMLKEI